MIPGGNLWDYWSSLDAIGHYGRLYILVGIYGICTYYVIKVNIYDMMVMIFENIKNENFQKWKDK